MSQTGTLIVQVSAARQTLPVEGAAVSVTSRNGERSLVAFRLTDRSGRTPAIPLPAPDESESLHPAPALPYSVYDVKIAHPGYFTVDVENVQIFAGNESLEQADLIPLPDLPGLKKRDITYDIPPQDL